MCVCVCVCVWVCVCVCVRVGDVGGGVRSNFAHGFIIMYHFKITAVCLCFIMVTVFAVLQVHVLY